MDASGVSTAGPRVDGAVPDIDADDGRMPGSPAGSGRRGSRAMSGSRRR